MPPVLALLVQANRIALFYCGRQGCHLCPKPSHSMEISQKNTEVKTSESFLVGANVRNGDVKHPLTFCVSTRAPVESLSGRPQSLLVKSYSDDISSEGLRSRAPNDENADFPEKRKDEPSQTRLVATRLRMRKGHEREPRIGH